MLLINGAGDAWALDENNIFIQVIPSGKEGKGSVTATEGSVSASVSERDVTLTVTPTSGYKTKKTLIIAEKMVDPNRFSSRRRTSLTGTFEVTGSSDWATTETTYSFTVPSEYDGAYVTVTFLSTTSNQITSLSEITDLTADYELAQDIDASGLTTSLGAFSGTLDGNFHKIYNLSKPLFSSVNDGTVKNVTFEDVDITSGDADGDAGAVCSKATGDTRIYNCGINPSSADYDNDGDITGFTGSSVSGSRYVGSLVGFLDGSARVINCYSYANISGGTHNAGIVGYNNVATTSANLKTMVMNCMFYGNISGGSIAPIYNGEIITNLSTGTGTNNKGVSNYNYFWGGASYVENRNIQTYNCALMAETRFLQRFEFFRHLLNSHRELAAWWATGSTANKDQMMKWVLEPSQLGSSTPYPILKTPGYYPSVVNIDAEHATTQTERNKGGLLGTLSVTINMGSGGEQFASPTGANITTPSLTLNITDKDPDHFNFNYAKVQLPYYNDVGTGNYTGNRVVTGWKITSISGGTQGSFTTGDDATVDAEGKITAAPYNFADRQCTDKDLYDVSGRVFSQGAYWDVPEGVTAITIEPYWAKAAYLADANVDVVYDQAMNNAYQVPNVGGGQIYTNDQNYSIAGENQKVYTDIGSAANALGKHSGHTVYDYAIVLVGNYHKHNGISSSDAEHFYTIMSADFDHDNEPDYSYILRFNGRTESHPVRVDFLNIPGLGMAQKSTGGTGTYNFGILIPKGWFESTNTSLFQFTQFEYEHSSRPATAPLILQGGVMEQWVSFNQKGVSNNIPYYHVGGNVWFKEFHCGTHQDRQQNTKHPPISVTGGDFDEFYLTGLYRGDFKAYDDNAECYINGGRFGIVAGTGMEGLGTSSGKGNIVWQIQNADINEFYGGGINATKPAIGNITTVIEGGYIKQFCGGPKFGNMNESKTVITTATGCKFDTYYGAGYGGNSYSRFTPSNINNISGDYGDSKWNTWLNDNYKQEYNSTYGGVSTTFTTQYIPMSNNYQNVARLLIDFVSFSLATTHDVTSNLTGCTITRNFYGGGSLGKVDGPVTSTLTDCTVGGSVFGAGFSASLPTVEVMNTGGFIKAPFFDSNLGVYMAPTFPATVTYSWQHANTVNSTETAIDKTNHILYTTEDLTMLGTVTGTATLNIDGTTTVGGSVYGGGEESNVSGNTQVNVCAHYDSTTQNWESTAGTASITHNVFGGGKGTANTFTCEKAMVGIDNEGACEDPSSDTNKIKGTSVHIGNGSVNGNVYGGGEVGRVEWNTAVTIGIEGDDNSTPEISGSVFGAGAGLETHGYSALVRGNSSVTVQGKAKVLQNVYGGGEKATVGRYWVKGIATTPCTGETLPTEPTDLPDGMPYQQRRGGKCIVTIQDEAQVGPDDGGTETAGHVFGAGKGVLPVYTVKESKRMAAYDATKHGTGEGETWDYYPDDHRYVWEYFATEDAYLEYLQTLSLVTNSDVTITGEAKVKGSVYGGSESGYVQHNTNVTVSGGTIGTEDLGGADFGNVYGGGKGDAEHTGTNNNYLAAGIVKGCTKVKIENGTILHNIYGGGAYGSVGVFDYNTSSLPTGIKTTAPTNSGKTEIYITGGTIGTTGEENGMIFGSSRGDVGAPNSIHDKLAWVYDTHVAIGDTTTNTTTTATPIIKGSVYGGGENGHNLSNAYVRINGGTIGIVDDASYPYRGNVYGGGCGTDKYYTDTEGVANPYDGNGNAYNPLAGIVQGNATVNMTGGHVVHNIYGAGAMGSVGTIASQTQTVGTPGTITMGDQVMPMIYGFVLSVPYKMTYAANTGLCEVNITGGTVGVDGNSNGDIYGAARGEAGETYAMALLANIRKAEVTIGQEGTTSDAVPDIKGSVYGGGENGHTMEDAYVTIHGGLIGHSVFGSGKGTDKYPKTLKRWDTDAEYDGESYDVTAGKVYGNAYVEIKGGLVKDNVYGGGKLASIGKGNYSGGTDDYFPMGYGETINENLWDGSNQNSIDFLSSGKATVKVTGGTIGTANGVDETGLMPTGNVFGGSQGEAAPNIFLQPTDDYNPAFHVANINEAEVIIGTENDATDGPRIYGSVYGGGQDGHMRRDAKVTVYSGEIGNAYEEGVDLTDIQWEHRGNVFGAGSGFGKFRFDYNYDGTIDPNDPNEVGVSYLAGCVARFSEVNIHGGIIHRNVYGGGSVAGTGEPKFGMQTYEPFRKGDTVTDDPVFGAHSEGKQSISLVNVYGGTIGEAQYGGDVYGASRGDQALLTADHRFTTSIWTEVNILGGTIYHDVYGGGELGSVKQDTKVNLLGGEIKGDAYGGGKGTAAVAADIGSSLDNPPYLGGNTLVELNNNNSGETADGTKKGCIVTRIFGCNNVNGTPKGSATVHVYATQNAAATTIANPAVGEKTAKVTGRYDVAAVYGGGNMAAYEPLNAFSSDAATKSGALTNVIIEGCDKTSILQVYGGGNAASTPATQVTVNGTFEIDEVFGGGNGKDDIVVNNVTKPNPGANVGFKDYSATEDAPGVTPEELAAAKVAAEYGSGEAHVNIRGGKIHAVFGGSNTKGNVREIAIAMLEGETTDADYCEFCVDEAYGGGKSADMDGEAHLVMECIPGLTAVYGGAQNADVNNNVVLNITNGTFNQVFGGNNLGGRIMGSITVNIEETGCRPIIIGELYGGGNRAAYSVYGETPTGPVKYDDPVVNVKSFTSIGSIYGGGYGASATMEGSPTVNINVVEDATTAAQTHAAADYAGETKEIDGDEVSLPAHTKGKMGVIHQVFGGGNAAKVIGDTNVNIGTQGTVDYVTKFSGESEARTGLVVKGVDIRGNVYGGGNQAEVTGKTNVNIGQ